MKSNFKIVIPMIAALSASVMACSFEVKETDDDDDWNKVPPIIVDPDPAPDVRVAVKVENLEQHASSCVVDNSYYYYRDGYSSYFGGSSYICYENQDYRWQTSCESDVCDPVQVYVHYLLPEEIGDGLTVHVEAFDNNSFSGYPRGTVELTDFRARSGEWDKAELYLPPGEYYLRAFVKNVDEDPTPYTFDGMQLVAGEPVGIFGALSGPEKITVSPYKSLDPVHIKLDKLFTKPGSEPDTKAYLRVKMSTEAFDQLEVGKKVFIQLFEDDDFEKIPTHSFELASELLKIEGQVGMAEFVSPSLPLGNYVVRVFLDKDSNGFWDDGEIGATYSHLGTPKYVEAERDHIKTIAMILELPTVE